MTFIDFIFNAIRVIVIALLTDMTLQKIISSNI